MDNNKNIRIKRVASNLEKAVDYFESNPAVYEEVKAKILDAFYGRKGE